LRGRGKNSFKAFAIKPAVVNVGALEKHFDAGAVISPIELQKKGLINIRKGVLPQVKVLGTGELTKKLKVTDCFISGEAKAKIEKAGGSIEVKN
jgi:large subunit ribosomal protein L15